MGEKIDQLRADLKSKLSTVEESLEKAKSRIHASAEETKASLDAKKAEVESAMAAQKQKAAETKAKMDGAIEEKTAETKAKIDEWKMNREIHKLEKRADRSEDYAVWAMEVAANAVEEADIAVLDAIADRLDAEVAAAEA